MIATKISSIYDSVDDMFLALSEKGVSVSQRKMNLIPQMVASIRNVEYPEPIETEELHGIMAKTDAMYRIKCQIKDVIMASNVTIGSILSEYGDAIREIIRDLEIIGPSNVSGETCTYGCMKDGMKVEPEWSVISGSEYCSIDQGGMITVFENADAAQVIIQAEYAGVTAVKILTVTYSSGSSSNVTIDTDPNTGDTYVTITTDTDNGDGSSSSHSETTITDSDGNSIGSSTNDTETNSDGSSTSTTTNYDGSGNKTGELNEMTDTSGNVSTQTVTTDSEGNDTVSSYTIDTSASTEGEKSYEGDGEDTEFIPFDGQSGFSMHIRFKGAIADQPNPPIVNDPTDSSRLYTIVNLMEEAKPWPGIVLRFSSRSVNLVTTIVYYNTSGRSTTKTQDITKTSDNIYDLTITYDPTLDSNNISIYDNINSRTVWAVTGTIGQHNISTTLGYSYYPSGGYNYRYSKMDLYEFSIEKI